ncbi:Transmembrane protein 62 [Perkinsus chesapeaki]|uniref:Transmembrane protein 62 n=1 Tax=Perkinsus chesapeaki TaxID=330153 RepID=A0A7J6MUX7_PERCH|nr:Transmembrane protein 62 [Perkinsus chesapeaki]
MLLVNPVPATKDQQQQQQQQQKEEAVAPTPFLIHISDIHVSQFNNKTLDKLSTFCTQFLPRVKDQGMVATVLGGDLVDSNPRVWRGQPLGPIPEEWAKFREVIDTQCRPNGLILPVRGNHDAFTVTDYNDQRNVNYRSLADELLSDTPGLIRDAEGSWMLPVANDYLLIGLDLNPSTGSPRYFFGQFHTTTEEWLRREWLEKRPDKKAILISHYNFGSLYPEDRRRFVALLHEAPHFYVLLSGHTHTLFGHRMYAEMEGLPEMENAALVPVLCVIGGLAVMRFEADIPDFKTTGTVRLLQLPSTDTSPREWRYTVPAKGDLPPTILPPMVGVNGEVEVTVIGDSVRSVEVVAKHSHTTLHTRNGRLYYGRIDPVQQGLDSNAVVRVTYGSSGQSVDAYLVPKDLRKEYLSQPFRWEFTHLHAFMFLGSAGVWLGNIALTWLLRHQLERSGKLLWYLMWTVLLLLPFAPWAFGTGVKGCPAVVLPYGTLCLSHLTCRLPNDVYGIAFVILSVKYQLSLLAILTLSRCSGWSLVTIPLLLRWQLYATNWMAITYAPLALLCPISTIVWDLTFWYDVMRRYTNLFGKRTPPLGYEELQKPQHTSTSIGRDLSS